MTRSYDDMIDGVIDVEQLLARCLGNVEIAERVLTKFQDRFRVDLTELEQGLQQQDAAAVAQAAHRIKGASANVSAPALYALASDIEQAARTERLADVPEDAQQLRTEWTRFVDNVADLQLS